MLTQEKTQVKITKNEEVSTFHFRIQVPDGVACAYDFDGIFCEECPSEYKGSDDAYYKFLCTANPLHYPDKGYVPLIITGRHERYREITHKWLKQNNIEYGHMLMRDFSLPSEGYLELIASYKAKAYKEYDYDLFIESRLRQAKLMHELTGKPVFCPVGPVMLTKE
jgi:orotate phosphoribosyltransferase